MFGNIFRMKHPPKNLDAQWKTVAVLLQEKNATNLVNHLRSKHKDVAAELQMAQSVQRKDKEQKSQLLLQVTIN